MNSKTHYRKAFNSPYLSSADIVENTVLTISHVRLEGDKSKKSKDLFNTAYFVEKELRPGEKLKPMILNAGNSKKMKEITGEPFIEDWVNVRVTVYVKNDIKFGRDTVDGLRLTGAPKRAAIKRGTQNWDNAIAAYKRDGNFDAILKRVDITEEDKLLIIEESKNGVV